MSEIRKIKSFRVKPSITEKMNIIRKHLCIDTDFFNENKHTKRLGYSFKGNLTTDDVLEIAVNELYEKLFE